MEKELLFTGGSFSGIPIDGRRAIPEHLIINNMAVRYQYHSGIGGSCRIRIKNGDIRYEADFCLSDSEKAMGIRLVYCTYLHDHSVTLKIISSFFTGGI